MKSVLLVGQSNMAGRGYLDDVPKIYNEKIEVLRNGRFQMMVEPIHNDRPTVGVGLASSFALAWTAEYEEKLGLIPCAEGASSIDEWDINGPLFRHAVNEAKFAQESSEIIAILWHQGESDALENRYETYNNKLTKVIKELKNNLGLKDIPVIIGGLPDFLGKSGFGQSAVQYQEINDELVKYCHENENTYFVNTDKLTANIDGIHLDAKSQRIFGIRYYNAFNTKANIMDSSNEEETLTKLYNRSLTKGEKTYIAIEKYSYGKITMEELMQEFK